MNTSICITTFNEEGSIGPLLDSLVSQTKKADEIVIVDGGSTDATASVISNYQLPISNKNPKIKFLISKGATRSEGRNLSIELAKNDIIATTDAGCIAHKDWLKNITEPFNQDRVDISAGFYKMVGKSPEQKAMSVFLGVTPRHFDINFLPSTRSMAFRKSAWEEVGGFPEGRENSAEDTDFNYKAVKHGLNYARVKSAVVEWGMPENLKAFFTKIQSYAKWDVQYGIWWNPVQGLASHNIKALLVILRYLLGLGLLILSFWYPLLPYLLICLFSYFVFAFRKVFKEFGNSRTALWGPILQISADLAVMSGFIKGIIG
ncbi:MAG: glycosyltransferase [Candidatus Woesebacteria bacterium]|nr:glycosyltransferase [Candidatus Woesebacteria bacterium]